MGYAKGKARTRPADPEPLGDLSESLSASAGLQSMARNGALGVVGAACAAGLGFLLTFLVARDLGATGAGGFFASVALASILIALATIGADTGLLWALPRLRALSHGHESTRLLRVAILPVTLLSIALAAACWFMAPNLARQINADDPAALVPTLRVLALAVLLGPPLQVFMQATRALGNLAPFVAIQQVGLPALRVIGVALVGALTAPKLLNISIAWTAPLLLALAAGVWTTARRLAKTRDTCGSQNSTPISSGDFWRYSLVRGTGTALQLSLVWLDVLLVAILTTPAEAGVYAVVSRFATSGQLALQAMRLAVAPQISAAFAVKDHTTIRRLYSVSVMWATLISWPAFILIIIFAPWILTLFGAGFESGQKPLVVVSIAMMFNVAAGNVGTILLMSGKSSWSTASLAIALSVNVAANLLLIPVLGAFGAAIAWLLSILTQNIYGLWLIRSRLALSLYPKGVWTHLTASVAIPVAAALPAVLTFGLNFTGFVFTSMLSIVLLALYAYRRRRFLNLETLVSLRARRSAEDSSNESDQT